MTEYPATTIPMFPLFTAMRPFVHDEVKDVYKFEFENLYGAVVTGHGTTYSLNILINGNNYYDTDLFHCDDYGIDKLLNDIEGLHPGSLETKNK